MLPLIAVAIAGCVSTPTEIGRVVVVETKIQGHSAEYVEAMVTVPMERALASVAGVVGVKSVTSAVVSYIEVPFGTTPTNIQLEAVAHVIRSRRHSRHPGFPEALVEVRHGRLQ